MVETSGRPVRLALGITSVHRCGWCSLAEPRRHLHRRDSGARDVGQPAPHVSAGDLASLTGDGTFTITQSNPDLSSISAWKGKLHCRPPAS
jgi:hypothetical protein